MVPRIFEISVFLAEQRLIAEQEATTMSGDRLVLERKIGPVLQQLKPKASSEWGAKVKKEQPSESPERAAERKKVLEVGTSHIPHHPNKKCADPEDRFNDAKGQCAPVPLAARAHAATGAALRAKADSSRNVGDAHEYDKDAHDAHRDAAHALHKEGFKTVAAAHNETSTKETERKKKVRARMMRKMGVANARPSSSSPAPAESPKSAEPSKPAPSRERTPSDSSAAHLAVMKRIAAQASGKS